MTATIKTSPTAPVVGTITQPTLTLATGSVVLSGLPSSGTWTLTRAPGSITTTGTGTSKTLTGLPAGTTYTYKVTNSSGCTSVSSVNVVINIQPTGVVLKSANDTSIYKLVPISKNTIDGLPVLGSTTISVYPNPVSVSFALKINNATEGTIVVRIISSTGRKMQEFKADNSSDEVLDNIPVNNLADGMYVVQVLINNKDLYYTKIVVLK